MKNKSFILLAAAGVFAMSSCAKIVNAVVQTVTKGMEISIEQTASPISKAIFGDKSNTVVTDSDNNYIVPASGNLSTEVSSSQENISVPGEVVFSKDELPEIMKSDDANFPVPCCLEIENPGNSTYNFEADVKNGEQTIHVGPIPVKPGVNEINISDDKKVATLVADKNTKEVTVSGITLKMATSKSVTPAAAENITISVAGYVPMKFLPGYEFTYTLDLDDINFPNLKKYLTSAGVDAEAFSIDCQFTNSLPFDISASAECTLPDAKKGSASISPAVAAGTAEKPVKTSCTIQAKLDGEMTDIQTTVITIKGVVPKSKFSSAVTLNSEQSLEIYIEKLKIDEGITLSL